ncbi:MAG: ABC transporter ATP-binding protein [Clostridia bacterium]|nr:ABC transporter ATP-binding protein [Clostridia bacterium]
MPIEICALSKRFGDKPVLERITISLRSPGVTAITGPSGRGKTTLLRILAGLEQADSGSFSSPGRIACLFQDARLLPWLTAAQNISLVLGDTPEAMAAATIWLGRVELADAADKYPAELSGGMQQRVALARALAYGGDTILLDEPFRALDRPLRLRLYPLIREAAKTAAVVIVTHDPEDAAQLGADIIAL